MVTDNGTTFLTICGVVERNLLHPPFWHNAAGAADEMKLLKF